MNFTILQPINVKFYMLQSTSQKSLEIFINIDFKHSRYFLNSNV